MKFQLLIVDSDSPNYSPCTQLICWLVSRIVTLGLISKVMEVANFRAPYTQRRLEDSASFSQVFPVPICPIGVRFSMLSRWGNLLPSWDGDG